MDEYQAPPQKSWWGRNWKWVVPVGCLTPIVLVVGCFVAAFFAVSGVIKSTEVYTRSFAAVASDAKVQQALGEPITVGAMFSGNMNVSGEGGNADITYKVSGPKGAATVHVVADKKSGEWVFNTNHVHVESTNEELDVPVPAQ